MNALRLVPLSVTAPLDWDTLGARLCQRLLQPGPLPLLKPRTLRQLARNWPHQTAEAVARQVQHEPFVVARLLALANTGLLAPVGGPCFGIRACLQHIGVRKAATWLQEQAWDDQLEHCAGAQQLQDQLVDAALFMRHAATQCQGGPFPPGLAYAIGLLHRCGDLLLWQDHVLDRTSPPPADWLAQFSGPAFSGQLLERLEVPELLTAALVLPAAPLSPTLATAALLRQLLKVVLLTVNDEPTHAKAAGVLAIHHLGWTETYFRQLRTDWLHLRLHLRRTMAG